MIEDLQKLMSFGSVSLDQSTVGNLLDFVESRLEKRGLFVQRIEHSGVKSLYASSNGKPHTKVMLQGHVDVVPGDEDFATDGEIIKGRGCYDMLFGAASFLRLVDELDDPSKYDFSILLSGDEELGGEHGVGTILKKPDYTCDVCILPDAGEGFGSMSIAAKGVWQLRLRVSGASHHASRPWEGDGAGNKMMKFLNELSDIFDGSDRSNSTMTVAELYANGGAVNKGPADATCAIDIRYKDAEDKLRIQTRLTELTEKYNVSIDTEHTGSSFELDTSSQLVQDFISLYEHEYGTKIHYTRAHGSSDARFFSELGIPVIMLRPDGGGAHSDEEWLSIQSWEKFHTLLAKYVTSTAIIK